MSKSLKGQGKVAFGIFVDGLEMKFAHLSMKGGRIYIQDLRKVSLFKKLDERLPPGAGFTEEQELFTDSEPREQPLLLQSERTDTNAFVLVELLSQYPVKKYSLAYSLAEPTVYYHALEGNLQGKNGALKKRALEELKTIRQEGIDHDAVGLVPSQEKGVLCIVREDGLHLINTLEEVKHSLGNRLPRIPFIDGADLALMNVVRLSYELSPKEITVIVYVGVDFSRIIFMAGDQHLHFAPLITEGVETPNLDNRLYSRILLEQDSLDIQKFHRIVLAGNAHKIQLKDFLREHFPFVEVEYLELNALERTNPIEQTVEVCSEYAIPIATAWRALEPKNEKFSPVNLLPESFVQRQKFFRIAWHGYLAMVLIFCAALYFTWDALGKQAEIRTKTNILSEKQLRLAENLNVKSSIEELLNSIDLRRKALAIYDALVPGADQWSKVITETTRKVQELNSIWITSMNSSPDGGMVMTGYALYRNRIPRLAEFYDRATLKYVTVKEIRERKVYEFELYVPNVWNP